MARNSPLQLNTSVVIIHLKGGGSRTSGRGRNQELMNSLDFLSVFPLAFVLLILSRRA